MPLFVMHHVVLVCVGDGRKRLACDVEGKLDVEWLARVELRVDRTIDGMKRPVATKLALAAMASLDELAQAVVQGSKPEAWQALQVQVVPRIEAIARGHDSLRAKGMHASPDEIAEVRTATLERLADDDFQNLKRYLAQRDAAAAQPSSAFDSWIYGAVDFAVREHLRRRYGRAPKRVSTPPQAPRPNKRAVNTNATRLSGGALDRALIQTLAITAKLTAVAIFAYAEATFEPLEAQALRLYYLEERDFEQLAAELELPDAHAAERLIRTLNARLRYHFAPAER
ncbi:MAG TPA: hypothetical protein VF331_28195 [Polyangiales bacterium]